VFASDIQLRQLTTIDSNMMYMTYCRTGFTRSYTTFQWWFFKTYSGSSDTAMTKNR